jgi:hypothetical protein
MEFHKKMLREHTCRCIFFNKIVNHVASIMEHLGSNDQITSDSLFGQNVYHVLVQLNKT